MDLEDLESAGVDRGIGGRRDGLWMRCEITFDELFYQRFHFEMHM